MDREFEATFDAQGHFDIPAEMRERHGFTNGARVKVEDRKDGILIAPSLENGTRKNTKRRSMHDMVGFLGRDPKALNTLMDERRRDREKEDRPFGS